jgi:hypothetical protein
MVHSTADFCSNFLVNAHYTEKPAKPVMKPTDARWVKLNLVQADIHTEKRPKFTIFANSNFGVKLLSISGSKERRQHPTFGVYPPTHLRDCNMNCRGYVPSSAMSRRQICWRIAMPSVHAQYG